MALRAGVVEKLPVAQVLGPPLVPVIGDNVNFAAFLLLQNPAEP
jgi:hypothetical protein